MSEAKRGKILVTDDEPKIREFLYQMLTAEGYEVLTAGDGVEALAVATREHPDLVLLDYKMPKMDGMEACRQLRTNAATHHMRIIMLTTFDTREHLDESIAAGADDFLGKPLNLAELQVRVRSIFKVKHLSDEVERLGAYIKSIEKMRSEAAL